MCVGVGDGLGVEERRKVYAKRRRGCRRWRLVRRGVQVVACCKVSLILADEEL